MGLVVVFFVLVIACLTIWGCVTARKKFKGRWKLKDYYDRYGEDFRKEMKKRR